MGGLPAEAALWREDMPGWSQQDELLASCVEVIDAWGRQIVATLVAVHGGKLDDSGEPLRIRHPDRPEPDPEPSPASTDPAEIAAFLRPRTH